MGFAPPPGPELQPFSVPGPQYTDPLQTLAAMRQARAQNLQIQQSQLGLQQAQLEMQSQQGLMKAYQEAGGDMEKTAQLAPKYGVLPNHIMAMQQTIAEMANKRAQTNLYGSEADKNAIAAQDQEHDALYQAYTPAFGEKDPNKQAALVSQINQNLVGQGWDPKKLLQYTGPDSVQQAKAAYTTWTGIKARAEAAEKAATQAKMEAETAGIKRGQFVQDLLAAPRDPATNTPTPAATAALRQQYPQENIPETITPEWIQQRRAAQVPEEKAPDYELKMAEANAMKAYLKGGQEGMNAEVDGIIPPNDPMNGKIKAALQAAVKNANWDGIKGVMKEALDYAGSIAKEINPQVIGARVGQKVQEANALIPSEVAKTTKIEQAKAALSPDVFSQIIDPTARNRAMFETDKYTREYVGKMSDAQKILDAIDAAQKGNQKASGLIPLEQIRAIVNRVSGPELEGLGGGSLLRRVQNTLTHATKGTMSAGDLQDFRDLANLQKDAAKRTYDGNRQVTKGMYGVTPPDIDLSGTVSPAPGGAGPKGSIPRLPASLSQSDVGKTYFSPALKKNIKITKVNPANPAQFQYQ